MKKSNDYVWTPVGTDITVRWRAYGWVPPSELPTYLAKWKYFQELPMRKLSDSQKVEYENLLAKAKVARIK